MARQKTQGRKKPSKTPKKKVAVADSEVLLAQIAVRHTWAKTWRGFITLAGLALCIFASWPIASEFAGQETALNVSVALGLTASLTLAGSGFAAWGESQRRRANRLDGRNKQLSRDVKELQERLRSNDLSDKVSRG